MIVPRYQWRVPEVDQNAVDALVRVLAVPVAVARVLVSRGYASCDAANRFLSPDLISGLSDPFDFPGMRVAAERLWSTIDAGGRIVIFGDFDVDGVSATSILVTALRKLGATVSGFLPNRETEGYGLTERAVTRCLESLPEKPALLVTVDCGVTSVAEVAALTAQGIDVIVTDHHEPAEALPVAVAVIDPMLGATADAAWLCGAGVAFKLAHAMVQLGRMNGRYTGVNMAGDLLVMAGLATVADVVPLRGENRVLVWHALKKWCKYAPMGLKELLQKALARSEDHLTTEDFAFRLAPRLNAAGRMQSAHLAYDLLTTEDREEARMLASQLDGLNGMRKSTEKRMLESAQQQAQSTDAGIAVGETRAAGWHPGVAGIVSARLAEMFGKPAAVAILDDAGGGHGSARAPEGYHVLDVLKACSETLERFGGHAPAAGFTIKTGCFTAFQTAFATACAEQARYAPRQRTLTVDAWLESDDMTVPFFEAFQALAPFGQENAEPVWGARGVAMKDVQPLGRDGKHVSIQFEGLPRATWFNVGDLVELLRAQAARRFDAAFHLRLSTFGELHVELNLVDIRPAEEVAP